MGYTTEFEGEFTLDKPLKPEHAQYLQAFQSTRRMRRLTKADIDAGQLEAIQRDCGNRVGAVAFAPCDDLPDPVRTAVGLPVGPQGAYFVGGGGFAGQDKDDSIVDYNQPPTGQPSLWCQWEPNEEGTTIRWDGAEKFYEYTAWLQYLIHHFLAKWGYVVNGEVTWQGEERSDVGKIVVKNNEVTTKEGRVVFDGDEDDEDDEDD
jgi:hypothetical protein